MQIEDKEILDLFKNPNTKEKGFNLFVKKYQQTIYWHIRRILISHENTNDVLQNFFIKIWQNLHKFKEKSQLYTWLYRIATNEAISFINNAEKKYADSFGEEYENTIANSLTDDNYFKGSEIELKLQKAILTLPTKQRIVFLLRYYQNISYSDMGKILDTKENTLKATFHRAVQKIEKIIKDE